MTVGPAALAVVVGAALQSATGFGFAMLSAPILFALYGPREAVSAGALLGIELSALTLATERRVPVVLRGEAIGVVAASLPGLALGAVALRELPDRALSVLVALAVLAGLGVRLHGRARGERAVVDAPPSELALAPAPSPSRSREVRAVAEGLSGIAAVAPSREDPAVASGLAGTAAPSRLREDPAVAGGPAGTGPLGPARPWRTAAAGLISGALSTATSLGGPPLVLHLLARGASPQQMRDTLAAVFVAIAVLTAAALLIAGTFVLPPGIVVLVAAALAGQVAGRRAFAWLAGDRHEDAVLAVLAVAAVVAMASSVL